MQIQHRTPMHFDVMNILFWGSLLQKNLYNIVCTPLFFNTHPLTYLFPAVAACDIHDNAHHHH